MTPTKLCFIDTETTSLRPARQPWEVAIISRDHTGRSEYLERLDVDITKADPAALAVSGFYDRHPRGMVIAGISDSVDWWGPVDTYDDHHMRVAVDIAAATHGATIVGANPSFDTETLDRFLRRRGILPSWHYRIIDITSLTWGDFGRPVGGLDGCAVALGLEWPEGDRHTALGDARMCERIWDLVMGDVSRAGGDR